MKCPGWDLAAESGSFDGGPSCAEPPGSSADDDLGSCIAVCFFEMIPTLPPAVEDMPRWWTREEVMGTKAILSHLVGEEGFARIIERFDRRSGPADGTSGGKEGA